MDIVQLRDKLYEINRMGYVVSLRKGNTGIGYTLETLLGLEENNLKTPDFGDVELKSQRNGVSNPVTMFTFNRGAWKMKQKDLIEKYGYIDTNERSSLYCTVNSTPNNQGLYVKIEQEAVKLYHVDGSLIAEWAGENLINSFMKKMPALVIVYADARTNSEEKEEFWFNEAFYLTQPNEDNLLDLVKQDIIIVDVRMHLKENGAVRNHGTAFRIDERFWNLCFGNREKLI
ncbi:MAG: MvaI/BcnI family restriction endonuclease [Candidatus Poribacteria bacterium]|nr:MvaI/BcnI family restriction endonuclease [Candidatus Poribacteria bacterium]